MNIVVEKILILLEKSELSTRQFEQRIGLCNASISAWKNGKASPSAKALQKIADYFGLSVDYFYKDNTNNASEPALPGEETRTLSDEEKQLINLILSLTDEETAELNNFVDYIISKRK